jgi:hypothetical protein
MQSLTVTRPENSDILSMLLQDKRSENTRKAYRRENHQGEVTAILSAIA